MFRAPGLRHQRAVGNLLTALYDHGGMPRRGTLVMNCGVALSAQTWVQPDLLYVSRERRGIITERYIQGPPDMVVEIISPESERTDRVFKRDLYAKHGVRYYWLAHPQEEWLRAYELGTDGSYELVAEGQGDTPFLAPPFPDLTIQLADVWED